jgi:hypothetical protein
VTRFGTCSFFACLRRLDKHCLASPPTVFLTRGAARRGEAKHTHTLDLDTDSLAPTAHPPPARLARDPRDVSVVVEKRGDRVQA